MPREMLMGIEDLALNSRCARCGRDLADGGDSPVTRLGALCWPCYDAVLVLAGGDRSMVEGFTVADACVLEEDD